MEGYGQRLFELLKLHRQKNLGDTVQRLMHLPARLVFAATSADTDASAHFRGGGGGWPTGWTTAGKAHIDSDLQSQLILPEHFSAAVCE
jgi:hypothetical protein